MSRLVALALLLAPFSLPCAAVECRGQAADCAAVGGVVERFRAALAGKDKPAYMALFFSDQPEQVGWQFVSEDTRLGQIRKQKPDAIKARHIPGNNFIALIDGAVATPEQREETVADLRIESDGEIASASFDYTFVANGVTTNWGREMWQLVRTEQGWKIFSVVYTIRDKLSSPDAAPAP